MLCAIHGQYSVHKYLEKASTYKLLERTAHHSLRCICLVRWLSCIVLSMDFPCFCIVAEGQHAIASEDNVQQHGQHSNSVPVFAQQCRRASSVALESWSLCHIFRHLNLTQHLCCHVAAVHGVYDCSDNPPRESLRPRPLNSQVHAIQVRSRCPLADH
jgi:hypothetical protein